MDVEELVLINAPTEELQTPLPSYRKLVEAKQDILWQQLRYVSIQEAIAEWLKTIVKEVSAQWIGAGDLYWRAS